MILNPVYTGKTVADPFIEGYLYAAYQASLDQEVSTFDNIQH